MAAEYFRENKPIPADPESLGLSQRFKRLDAAEKVNGTGLYADDLTFPDMLYAKAVRSKYPRALVRKIDVSKAVAHPDCVRVLTAKDVPFNKHGHIFTDWDVMIAEGDITRYVGDAVALVAVTRKEVLDEVVNLVEVDFEELPAVTTIEAALAPDAPKLHENGNIMSRAELKRGNADEAIKNAKYVVTQKYSTPLQDHAFMEPECAVAVPEGDDALTVYTGSQSIYDDQREIAAMLKLPAEKVHVHSQLVGGGFGGKEDMSVQHHAALMAWVTKKPVKVKFSRQESLDYHPKRHPMELEITTACDENGILTALKGQVYTDTGAYASLGAPVLHRTCTHAAGPYHFHNVDIEGTAVYTNNVVAGAFRGFGVTQSCFAMENNLNLLAEKVGITPWEIRYRNAIRPGQELPNGQIADQSVTLAQCLEAVKDVYESSPYAGIACGFKNSGVGMGLNDVGRCLLSVEDGKVHIRTSAACIGQGLATVCATIVCAQTGLPPASVIHEAPDTRRTPNAGTTTASRQTVLTGEATRQAAEMLKAELDAGKTLADLEGREFFAEYAPPTDALGSDKKNPVSHVTYGYGVQVVVLDETGKVQKVVAAYDVGTPVNIQAVEGQIEGGIVMGLGFALTEDFRTENGYPKEKLGTLGLMRSTDAPQMQVILCESETKNPMAFGAKGCGELAAIPTAPACCHAYYRFDGKFRTSLPFQDTFYKKPKKNV